MAGIRILKKALGEWRRPSLPCSPVYTSLHSWQPLHFPGSGESVLSGLFGRALEHDARGTIVCAHPKCKEGMAYFLQSGHADLLRAAGFNVLLFDFNGFGASTTSDGFYYEDILAAGRAARRLTGDVPLGLLGISFGAAWSVAALTSPGHPFRAAVLEGAYARLAGWPYGTPLPQLVLNLLQNYSTGLTRRLSPVLDIVNVRDVDSLLFIYGGADTVTPVQVGREYLRACRRAWVPVSPEPAWIRFPDVRFTYWEVPDAEHAKALETEPVEYIHRVSGLFEASLHLAS